MSDAAAAKTRPPLSKRKRRLFAAIAFAGSALLLLCTLEVGLTIAARDRPPNRLETGPKFEWGHSVKGVTWGHSIEINSHGFREREFTCPKPAGTFRVAVIGDSLTWGAGLALEERYSDRLQALLRERNPERKVEVLNFGLAGCPTAVEAGILEHVAPKVEPDLVVVGFCVNDPKFAGSRDSQESRAWRPLLELARAPAKLGLTRSANFLHERTWDVLVGVGAIPDWIEALGRSYSGSEWKVFELSLARIAKVCTDRGLPQPIFAGLLQAGTIDQIREQTDQVKAMLAWHHQALEAAERAGFRTVFFHDALLEAFEPGTKLAVNPWDGHPGPGCNQVYAEGLLPLVEADLRRAGK